MHPKSTAVALTAAVVGALGYLAYANRVSVGDVVEIPSSAIREGKAIPFGANPDAHVAIQVTNASGDILQGFLKGVVENGKIVTEALGEVQGLSWTFPRSAVVKKF